MLSRGNCKPNYNFLKFASLSTPLSTPLSKWELQIPLVKNIWHINRGFFWFWLPLPQPAPPVLHSKQLIAVWDAMLLAKLTNFIRIHACKCISVFLKKEKRKSRRTEKLYGKPCWQRKNNSACCQNFAATGEIDVKNMD